MTPIKIIFLGSNPSQRSISIKPFWRDTKSMQVISNWLDMLNLGEEEIYFMNVSDTTTPNNRPLKISEIKASLPMLSNKINDVIPEKIIALGKTAEKALTLLRIPHFAMPHPSGLNRQLNNKEFIEEKIKSLQEYLQAP